MKPIHDILHLYGISGGKAKPLAGGLINKTWKIQTKKQSYILQWVNPIFSQKIMNDLEAVTAHLKKKDFLTIEIIKTKNKKLYVPDVEGFWRLYTFIPGVIYEDAHSQKIAREAGRVLGQFHKALSDLKHKFNYSRPLHRESGKIYKKNLAFN